MLIPYKIYLNLWIYTSIFITIAFSIDFYLEKYKLKINCVKTAAIVSIGWIVTALIFNCLLWFYLKININIHIANQKFLEFLTGYLLEKSLSLDNIFIFILIFKYFNIPNNYQRLVLNYGIIGAIIFRLLMIFGGIWLINKIHWILYIFGGILIISGGKILISDLFIRNKKHDNNLNNNFIIQILSKYCRTTKELFAEQFFIIKKNKLYATPLLLALICIEISDIIFAIDSIPAILVILNDPFIIFTSNMFAILGLRALYFFLAIGVGKFKYLQEGIAIILIFIGIKILFGIKLPIIITLIFITTVITTSILLSILLNSSQQK